MVESAGATRKARGWSAREAGVDRYVGLEHLDSNCLTIRRWGSPEDVGANSDLRHFEPGDVILARRGIELRKVGVPEFRGVASGHALVFRAKSEVVLPEFLPFLMQSDVFMKRADQLSVGSLSRTVNLSSMLKEEFALPPLAEQRRFALALRASLLAYNALLAAAESFADVCDAKLQTFFSGASRRPLSSVAEKVTKGTTPTTHGYDYVQNEIPFIRAEDVFNQEVNVASCEKHIGKNAHQAFARSQILPSDVLLTIAGTVGRAGLVTVESGEANCNQAVAIIRLTDSRDARFLFTWLMSRDARHQMLGDKVTGTISNLSLTSVKNLKLPMLTSEKRDQVSREFEALVNNRKRIEDRAAELRRIQGDILNRSLPGGMGR